MNSLLPPCSSSEYPLSDPFKNEFSSHATSSTSLDRLLEVIQVI